jgi:mono/diheme cytochrome c family protein
MKTRISKLLPILVVFAAMFITLSAQAQTKPWVAPATAQAVTNPVTPDASTLKDAKVLYMTNCAPCHGDKGKGDGPAAAALNPKPADHTSAALKNESDGSLFWKISEGRSPMPTYKTTFTPAQRWELVNYIRSLSKSGVKNSQSR